MRRWLAWVSLACLAAIPLAFFVARFNVPGYLDSTMGNLLATLVGVIAGVPVALEIARRQQDTAAQSEQAFREAEHLGRRVRVLSLLRTELLDNICRIEERRNSIPEGPRTVLAEPLREHLWNAFADGGELAYVDNPDVLAALARAYHHISTLQRLESEFLSVAHFPGVRVHQKETGEERLLRYLTASDAEALSSIRDAVAAIDVVIRSGQSE